MTVSSTLKEIIDIPCYVTDKNDVLSVSAFMDFAQQVAGEHADRYGFGHDDLIKDGVVWIVSRMRIAFLKPIKWKDRIELTTWHKGLEDRLFFRREYVAKDMLTNQDVALSTSSWLLLDINKRTLVRTHELCTKEETIVKKDALEEACVRLRVPKGYYKEFVFSHIARRSDIDRNRHVNNARYAAWAIDALPDEQIDAQVKEFEINFNHELRLGERIDLFRYRESEKVFFVEGTSGDESTFITKIVYGRIDISYRRICSNTSDKEC